VLCTGLITIFSPARIEIESNSLRKPYDICAIKMKAISIGRGGQMVPLVGFGLWRIDNDSCADAVYNAIKAGYRLFDGACGIALLTMLVLMHFADR
jgi:hypothetical protein